MMKKVFFVLLASSVSLFLVIIFSNNSSKIEDEENISPQDCGKYPREQNITIDNIVWQVLQIPKGFVKLLNAYVDLRQNLSLVRVNVVSPFLNLSLDLIFCQFWFDNEPHPYVVKASDYVLMWIPAWGYQRNNQPPFLISCPFNFSGRIPDSVSLTAKPCDHAENLLRIINPQPFNGTKKKFAVCSKQISYENRDFGIRFIEWVHLMSILGAEKVYFFNRFLHPEIFKVVQYFELEGLVETWPFLEPSGISDVTLRSRQTYLLEMNMINDCFHRVKNLYEFVLVVDFDEVILPTNPEDLTWHDLFARINRDIPRRYDGYVNRNAYYPNTNLTLYDGIPPYMYILQHTQKSVVFVPGGSAMKSFVGTERALVVHNHTPIRCISYSNGCTNFSFNSSYSQNSHYRSGLEESVYNVTEEDRSIWKYKDRLIRDVQETLESTGFKP